LDALQARLHQQDQLSLPLVVTGQLADLRTRAERTAAVLEQAVRSGSVLAFTLPTLLAPQPSVQRTNEPVLKWLVAEQVRLERLLEEMGFTAEAGALLRGVCAAWREGMSQDAASTGGGSGAVPASLRRFLRVEGLERSATTGLAVGAGAMLGEVQIPWPEGDEAAGARAAETLRQALEPLPGVSLASWQTLGARLTAQVRSGLTRQLWPVLALILVTLLVTFRSVKDTLLALAMLLLGLGGLVATMRLTGQTWNLANLASIPLLLGTGIDYGIHMLLALQRSGNQVAHVRRTTGRAVFFSGMTTVIGFGSLGLAGNRGIASLGWVCAVGSLWILLVVLWLLPCWRVWTCRRASNREET
jgi:predicted exporter